MTVAVDARLLKVVVLDRQDVRDRYLARTYRELLHDALQTIGVNGADSFTEAQAKDILGRSYQAARRDLHGDLAASARAAAVVLRAASKAASRPSK